MKKRVVFTQDYTSLGMPDSGGVAAACYRAGNYVYVTGQTAFTLDGKLVGVGDPAVQARQAMENIKTLIGPTSTGALVPTLAEAGYLIQIDAIAVVDTPRKYADAPTPNVVKKLRLDAPFRQGVKCGNTIYTSGQVALGENGEALHPTDIARQTRVAMENIKALLAEFGATTGCPQCVAVV